jgi:hypothetical protein
MISSTSTGLFGLAKFSRFKIVSKSFTRIDILFLPWPFQKKNSVGFNSDKIMPIAFEKCKVLWLGSHRLNFLHWPVYKNNLLSTVTIRSKNLTLNYCKDPIKESYNF